MNTISKETLKEIFASEQKQHYKKKGTFIFRPALVGETVLTIVNGKLETVKTAGPDEIVVRNFEVGSSAETYIIPSSDFKKRYDTFPVIDYTIDGVSWQWATAKGEVMAFQYHGETIKFNAPWGAEMICYSGDFIANPVGGSPDDIYRIEGETFKMTYFLVD